MYPVVKNKYKYMLFIEFYEKDNEIVKTFEQYSIINE